MSALLNESVTSCQFSCYSHSLKRGIKTICRNPNVLVVPLFFGILNLEIILRQIKQALQRNEIEKFRAYMEYHIYFLITRFLNY